MDELMEDSVFDDYGDSDAFSPEPVSAPLRPLSSNTFGEPHADMETGCEEGCSQEISTRTESCEGNDRKEDGPVNTKDYQITCEEEAEARKRRGL
jgi:hypothetical protein